MTIEEFLSPDHDIRVPVLPDGTTHTASDFFDNAICIPPNPAIVKEWHRLLTRYMEDPNAVILSRLYESTPDPVERWATRRGMMTRMADGFSYACASNHFGRIIFTMAYNDFVPEYSDFLRMFTERRISLSHAFRTNPIERECPAFRLQPYHGKFYTPGWYLAHILAINKDKYLGYPAVNFKDIITLGQNDDWRNSPCPNVRLLPETLTDEQKTIAKAYFLRFIDPINYFLVPGKKHVSIKTIGEKKEIVNFMRKKYSDTYGDVYLDFMEKALGNQRLIPAENCEELGRQQITVSFWTNAADDDDDAEGVQFTNQDKARCLKAYLFDGLSFRKLERNILHIDSPARGGGFKAQTMMHDFGLVTANKGMLAGQGLPQALNQAEGLVKSALEYIRDNLPEHD